MSSLTSIGLLRRPPCVDLQVCLDSSRGYAMHDSSHIDYSMQQRNLVQQIDLATQTTMMTAHEFSEHFELMCIAPGGGGGDWGNELYAGAVHKGNLCAGMGCTDCVTEENNRCSAIIMAKRQDAIGCAGFCRHCHNRGISSLCYHKAKSATAALCVFDLRAQMSMASLPPCLVDLPRQSHQTEP